jgi:uncharacterized protein YlxW (UPF0749 family)
MRQVIRQVEHMAIDKIKWQVTVSLLLIFLGIFMSVNFTHRGSPAYLERQDQEDLLAIWRDLDTKKHNLEEEMEILQRKKAALAQAATADNDALSGILEQRDTMYQVNGMVAVKGPGVQVEFSGETPLLYLDLVDIVNELWVSGAEAIAVNDQRACATTSFYFKDTDSGIFLTCNGKTLSYPIVIKAVGSPSMLETGLTFPGGIVDNLSTLYNIKPSIKQVEELEIPAREASGLDRLSDFVSGSGYFSRD